MTRAPICPGCGEPAANYPPSFAVEDNEAPRSWWCLRCLDARVRSAQRERRELPAWWVLFHTTREEAEACLECGRERDA